MREDERYRNFGWNQRRVKTEKREDKYLGRQLRLHEVADVCQVKLERNHQKFKLERSKRGPSHFKTKTLCKTRRCAALISSPVGHANKK